jgi:hypothetical protein
MPQPAQREQPQGAGPSTVLAVELGGDLPCVRCRYNLRGLSIRSVCPECGVPVRATLLAVVDPHASELRPLFAPRLTGMALLVWSVSAMLAAVCTWSMRLAGPSWGGVGGALPAIAVVVLVALSGVGMLGFVRPHAGPVAARGAWFAAIALAAYAVLVWALWHLHVGFDLAGVPAYARGGAAVPRLRLVLVAHVCMAVIALGLRPNARLLWVRSLLMRSGRVDRQTLLAVAAVVGVAIAGDVLRLVATTLSGGPGELLDQVGQLLILVGSVLLTIGLGGIVTDTVRLYGVVVERPLSIEGLLTPARAEGGPG